MKSDVVRGRSTDRLFAARVWSSRGAQRPKQDGIVGLVPVVRAARRRSEAGSSQQSEAVALAGAAAVEVDAELVRLAPWGGVRTEWTTDDSPPSVPSLLVLAWRQSNEAQSS